MEALLLSSLCIEWGRLPLVTSLLWLHLLCWISCHLRLHRISSIALLKGRRCSIPSWIRIYKILLRLLLLRLLERVELLLAWPPVLAIATAQIVVRPGEHVR